MKRHFICAAVLSLAVATLAQERGIKGQEAPAWDIDAWINLPEGAKSLEIDSFRGRVLYLFTFQSW